MTEADNMFSIEPSKTKSAAEQDGFDGYSEIYFVYECVACNIKFFGKSKSKKSNKNRVRRHLKSDKHQMRVTARNLGGMDDVLKESTRVRCKLCHLKFESPNELPFTLKEHRTSMLHKERLQAFMNRGGMKLRSELELERINEDPSGEVKKRSKPKDFKESGNKVRKKNCTMSKPVKDVNQIETNKSMQLFAGIDKTIVDENEFIIAAFEIRMAQHWPNPKSEFFCRVCNYAEFMDKKRLNDHNSSVQHAAYMRSYDRAFCLYCQIHCVDIEGMQEHKKDKNHVRFFKILCEIHQSASKYFRQCHQNTAKQQSTNTPSEKDVLYAQDLTKDGFISVHGCTLCKKLFKRNTQLYNAWQHLNTRHHKVNLSHLHAQK